MTNRQLLAAVKRVSWSKPEVEKLAATLLRSKVRVYRKTLRELAAQYGVEAQIKMTDDVKAALAEESLKAANQIARTRNSAAIRIARRLRATGLSDKRIEQDLRILINQRQNKRRELVAITEAYSAHADATLAFFRDAGDLSQMNFGGHPELGDAPPECEVCRAIIDGNPWSVDQAIRIGTPHPQCRQSWHADLNQPLPDTVTVGEKIAGVVGRESLVSRAGSHAAAADLIRDRSV